MKREAFESVQTLRPNIPALTGLRFFAAFFILFAHSVDWLAQFQDSQIRTNFTFVAMYGMPLFFVLSGFVIHYNYGKLFGTKPIARATVEFAAARFARLFPLYFCFLLFAIVADDFMLQTREDPALAAKILAYYVTLTQTWGYYVYESRNIIYWLFSVSWSISTEMFFYLAYVPAVYLILRIRGVNRALLTAGLYAVVTTVGFVWLRYELGPLLDFAKAHVRSYVDIAIAFEHSFYRWLFYFSPYARVFEFFMGCLTAHLFIAMRDRSVTPAERRVGTIALAVALGILIMEGGLYQNWITVGVFDPYIKHLALNFLCAPAIAVVMFCACRYDNAFSRFMSLPFLVLLGDTSYSIYLVHAWTFRIFNHPLANFDWVSGLEAILRVTVAITFTLIVAYATYRLIEVPSRAWLRRRLGEAIVAGFGGQSPEASASHLSAAGTFPLRPRLLFAGSVVGLVMSVGVVQVIGSDSAMAKLHRFWVGDRPEISIVSATYGLNCQRYPVPHPFKNLVAPGNYTKTLERTCNSLQRCDFLLNASRTGDPANSCGKDFAVSYRCTGSEELRSASLPPEADGKTISLDCIEKR